MTGCVFYFYKQHMYQESNIKYIVFLEQLEANNIKEVTLTDSAYIKFKLINDNVTYYTDNPRLYNLKELLLLSGVVVREGGGASLTFQGLAGFVLSICGLFMFYTLMNKRGSSMSKVKFESIINKTNKVTFKDIEGNEEAKDSVSDVIDFIKDPDKYKKLGARIPRGLMFYGNPGTGKTLMARALAAEASVPFFAVNGSDFVQMYVGVGAARVRELFSKAKKEKKAVIFIDEIDALAKKRSGKDIGNDERDQTLNALLTEMSGFYNDDGIVVIAATNRLDVIDEALLRPGRFDRIIEMGLPDVNARVNILKLYAENKPFTNEVDFDLLARDTVGFSGAMLESLLNEAAILAAKKGASYITKDDLDKAYYTILVGAEKKDKRSIAITDKRITAFHEAGHALVTRLTSPDSYIAKVSIIPSSKGTGGFCMNIPKDKLYMLKKEIEAQIMITLAGRAAEELIFGTDDVSTGAGNDIEKATMLAKDYINKYGMGDNTKLINLELFDEDDVSLKECSKLLDRLYINTKKLIGNNLVKLKALANILLEKETLNADDVINILN
jgi:cell division protease FtsH